MVIELEVNNQLLTMKIPVGSNPNDVFKTGIVQDLFLTRWLTVTVTLHTFLEVE